MWRFLTKEEAKEHPCHGNRGWLGLFVVLFTLFALLCGYIMLQVITDPNSEFRSRGGPYMADVISVIAAFAFFAAFPLLSLFHFRLTPEVTALIMTGAVLAGMIIDVIWPSASLIGSLIFFGVAVILVVLFLRYLFLGHRPNLTYKNRVWAPYDAP